MKEFVIRVGTEIQLLGNIIFDPYTKSLIMHSPKMALKSKSYFVKSLQDELWWMKFRFCSYSSVVIMLTGVLVYGWKWYVRNIKEVSPKARVRMKIPFWAFDGDDPHVQTWKLKEKEKE